MIARKEKEKEVENKSVQGRLSTFNFQLSTLKL